MQNNNTSKDFLQLVAVTADLCFKPWKHTVVNKDSPANNSWNLDDQIELVFRIECRNIEGNRFINNDLDLEIYSSGKDVNIMIGWPNKLDQPILWQGEHSVWMDASTGKPCHVPSDGESLESFARRLRALFTQQED